MMQRRILIAMWCFTFWTLVSGWSLTGADGKTVATETDVASDQEFVVLCESCLDNLFRLWPDWGTEVGLHGFDRQLGDYSRVGIDNKVKALESFRERFEMVDTDKLSKNERIDYALAVSDIESRLNQLENIRMWQKNANMYSSIAPASIDALIKRNYAPLPEPDWSPEKVEEHIRFFSRQVVLNTSVHEAYPGH
jgi:hypothetical protein